MSVRRTALDVLTRPRLREIALVVGIDFYSTTSREDMLDSVSRSHSVPFKKLLDQYLRDELKLACQRLDLDETGRERRELIKRIVSADRRTREVNTKPAPIKHAGTVATRTTRVSHSRGTSTFLDGVADMDEPKVVTAQHDAMNSQEEPTRVELVWPGKRHEVDRVVLPFQCIEVVNESRATREAEKAMPMARSFKAGLASTTETTWRNKLIWGDNKYVLGSLLQDFAGQARLVYIDPPFASGQDFSLQVHIGDHEWTKEPSLVEEKAYRDTWGRGTASYLQMIYERLVLIRDLLRADGTLVVHLDYRVSHPVKCLLDEVFGTDNFRNEIVVKRRITKNLQNQFDTIQALPWGHDVLLMYSKTAGFRYIPLMVPYESEKPEGYWHHFWNNADRPTMRYDLLGVTPKNGQWKWSKDRAAIAVANYKKFLAEAKGRTLVEYWEATGKSLEFIRLSETGKVENWFSPSTERIGNTLWMDIHAYENSKDYATQKHTQLLERLIGWTTGPGDLVVDVFAGSGTTVVAAETAGRRWICADLSRWSVQVTRKRLLDTEGCRPFEVLNLGKYERQYWQGVTFGKGRGEQKALHEYVRFVLELYRAESTSGLTHIHGQRGGSMIHVGAADSPVTLAEIRDAVDECKKIKQAKLDILGWEWEMGLHDVVEAESKRSGVKLRLLQIPRECMDQRAVDAGDVHFYELAYLEVESERHSGSKEVRIKLKNFVIPSPELIPDDVRSKIKKWSDFIDYWSVDFEFNEDVFHNQWQDYRTRSKRDLELTTDWHEYAKGGAYKVLVKVFDVFGNDTTQLLEVRV